MRVGKETALTLARASTPRLEADDVAAILSILQAHGMAAFSLPRERAHLRKAGYHRSIGPDGMADIFFVWQGGRLNREGRWGLEERWYAAGTAGWIEVKKPGARTDKRRTLTQRSFRERMIQAGCLYISIDPKSQKTAAEQVREALGL